MSERASPQRSVPSAGPREPTTLDARHRYLAQRNSSEGRRDSNPRYPFDLRKLDSIHKTETPQAAACDVSAGQRATTDRSGAEGIRTPDPSMRTKFESHCGAAVKTSLQASEVRYLLLTLCASV